MGGGRDATGGCHIWTLRRSADTHLNHKGEHGSIHRRACDETHQPFIHVMYLSCYVASKFISTLYKNKKYLYFLDILDRNKSVTRSVELEILKYESCKISSEESATKEV